MDITDLRDRILPLLLPYGVKRVALFGSVARGEDRPDSDFDLLVAFAEPVGLFALARIERALSEKLERPVDLLPEGAVNRHVRPFVEHDKTVIYEA